MQVFDLFNTDYERRLAEGAVDRLEQRRIDDLNMKMDELARMAKQARDSGHPESAVGFLKKFQELKAERDSYYKIKEGEVTRTATGIKHRSTDAYGGTPKEKDPLAKLDKATTNSLEKSMGVRFDREKKYQGGLDLDEGSMKHMMHKDAERMSREQFCDLYGDEHGEFWDNIMGDLDEGKWNYPDYMTQKANQDDEAELGISGRNKDRRKEWRKKQKAQAHKELMTGKKKEQSIDEAGIGHDIANKAEKIARATPPNKAGAVASTIKNAAKWLAGKGGPGKEGPTYEGTETQWSKESNWKAIPKAKSGKPADPRGEVTHLSDVARRKAERKADQKKKSKEVDEGFQDFNKVEPYAVCLAGKPVKKFDYYEDARRFHDNWKKKLYREGDKAKADKITLMPLNLDEERDPWKEKYFGPGKVVQKVFKVKADNGKSYNIKAETEQQAKETLQKHAPDANIVSIKFVSNVMDEAGSPAQQAAIAIAMKKAGKKPEHTDEGIVDTIRKKNYDRLANRSFNKARAAQDKASEYDFDNVGAREPHEKEFMNQMSKMRQREKKADELDNLDEFAPGGTMKPPETPKQKKDPWGDDNRSEIVKTVKRLLDAGNKVDSLLAGARGHIYAVAPDLAGFSMKKYNKPYAKGGLFRYMSGDEDDQVFIKMIKPGHYQLWNKELVDENKQGMAEESYSKVMESQGITDAKLLAVARRIDLFAKTIK